MSDEEAQKLWDACLIKSWRQFYTIRTAYAMFKSIANKSVYEFDLLRKPPDSYPWKVGVRFFVAERLPKINEKLYKLSPEHDVKLLRVLQKTKYTTATTRFTRDRERDSAIRKSKAENMKGLLNKTKYLDRNHNTNWNVTQ